MSDGGRWRGMVWAVTIVALCYSAAHFVQSGMLFPLRQENLAKFDEEMPPLRVHLQTGEPVHFNNAVQYGPVFFFVVHPPARLAPQSPRALSDWLYAIQIFCIGLGFIVTCATLRPFVRPRQVPLMIAWLAVLWLNFAPLYTILAVKSVETWEMCLLSIALYAFVRDKVWVMAAAVAAAALIKVLPAIFFFYLLITNRRVVRLRVRRTARAAPCQPRHIRTRDGLVVLAEGRGIGGWRVLRPPLARKPVAQGRDRQAARPSGNPLRAGAKRDQCAAVAGAPEGGRHTGRRVGADRPGAAGVDVAGRRGQIPRNDRMGVVAADRGHADLVAEHDLRIRHAGARRDQLCRGRPGRRRGADPPPSSRVGVSWRRDVSSGRATAAAGAEPLDVRGRPQPLERLLAPDGLRSVSVLLLSSRGPVSARRRDLAASAAAERGAAVASSSSG